jgi:hypothetical protein
VDGLLQSLFRGMSPDVAASRSFSAKELLDRGQAFLDSRSEVDPATRRAARLRMAELYRDVGAYKEAAAAFQAEASEALRAGDTAANALALWSWANVTLKTLDHDAAGKILKQLEQVVSAWPERSRGIEARLALLQGELALTQRRARDAQKALSQAEALMDPQVDLELVARAAQDQGAAAKMVGEVTAARAHLTRAEALQSRRGEDAVIDRLAVSLQIGSLENWAGRHAAASQALRATEAELQARLGPSHPLSVGAVCELAYAELRQGRFAQTRQALLRVRGSTGAADAWRQDYADLLEATAQLYEGQAQRAEPELQRLLKAMERDEGGISAATEPIRRLHAQALLQLKRPADAEAALREVEKNQLAFDHPDAFSIASTRVLLGVAWARQGRVEQARAIWEQAAAVMAKEVGPEHLSAMLAAGYAQLSPPPTAAHKAQRLALADRLQREAGWMTGVPLLIEMLRDHTRPTDWRQVPAAI